MTKTFNHVCEEFGLSSVTFVNFFRKNIADSHLRRGRWKGQGERKREGNLGFYVFYLIKKDMLYVL